MTDVQQELRNKLEGLERMPTIPAVLYPLIQYLELPPDQMEIQKVVDLISQDKSLAAQCLHMANSPLFGRWQKVNSVRSAVVSLGMQRMRDIAISCSVLALLPSGGSDVDPVVFWEHSLGCALVSRQFARKIGFSEPGKAYLAGLLHDIGIVAHLWIIPAEFQQCLETAAAKGIALHEAEIAYIGTDHCHTGKILGERWSLPAEIIATISCHHDPETASTQRELVSIISLSDLLCRMNGLGYGYIEERQVTFTEESAFAVLLSECPALRTFDLARFTFELEGYMEEVHRLVSVLYRGGR